MELTIEEKIYGLSLIWKEAEYNFAFWKRLPDLDWDKAYREALPKVIAAKTMRDYYLELARFISLLRDGHTGICRYPKEAQVETSFPIFIDFVEGKYRVQTADQSLGIEPFEEIFEINGEPVEKYLEEKIFPYFWHEKIDSCVWNISGFLSMVEYGRELKIRTESGEYTLQAMPGDKINWKPTPRLVPSVPLKTVFESKTHKIQMTDDNIAVITIPNFMEESLGKEFYANMPLLKDCRGYVIDIRNNGGGNSCFADEVVQAFINGEFETEADRKMVHIGTYKAWGQFCELDKMDLNDPWQKKTHDICTRQYFECDIEKRKIDVCPFTLTAPLVVLQNRGTASSAEDMLIAFDVAKRATLLGSASFGSTGQPLMFDLPGGGSARICTMWCTYLDGKEFVNIGVVPHVEVPETVEDLRKGYDRAMDKAVEILREKVN